MSETCQRILDQIAGCDTRKELLRIDHKIIPAALMSNEEQVVCDRAVEERLEALNGSTPPRTQHGVRATIHVQPGKG